MGKRRPELLHHQPNDFFDDIEQYGFAKLFGAIHGARIKTEAARMVSQSRCRSMANLTDRVQYEAIYDIHKEIDDIETIAVEIRRLYDRGFVNYFKEDRRFFADVEPDTVGKEDV